MNLTVIDHHHDEAENVYRLVIGREVEHVETMLDEDGNQLHGPDQPLVGVDGEPVLGPDDQPVMRPGDPMTETVIHVEPLEDFVFAADDERWEGKSAEEVAKAQRAIIAEALQAREHEAEKAARRAADARTALPGVGDPL